MTLKVLDEIDMKLLLVFPIRFTSYINVHVALNTSMISTR